jgi:ubiquinone biosynthesis protein Coq4
MRIIHPDESQVRAIVQAMHAVASANGRMPLLPVEEESIAAIQRHLLHRATPIPAPDTTLPDDLAATITDPVMRRETVRILAMLPIIDGKVLAQKADVVEAAAAQLGVDDLGLTLLRYGVKRQFKRMAFGIMMRSVAYYWSPTGKARLRDWLDMLRIGMPTIPGLYAVMTDRSLLARYRALEQHPADTLGHALYRFYTKRGYPLPGEPKSFPEGWSKHEVYHIVSEYETSDQGEMLNAAFSGGNTEVICMDLLMLTLLQFQAGFQVMPGPAPKGELRPDAFFRAVARGAATNVDLLNGWDLWTVVDLPVEEIRRRFAVPPLTDNERATLAEWNALIAA